MNLDDDIDPDDVLRPNQCHLDRAEVITPPVGVDVIDRNGQPTGKVMYNTSEPITLTLRGLKQVRAIEARRVRDVVAGEVAALTRTVAVLRGDVARLGAERDDLARQMREINRAAAEERVQARIAAAVSTAIEARDRDLSELRAKCATLESENAALREAKRRLRMAKGSR